MNLLCGPWVPVREGAAVRHVTYKDVLCTDADRQLSLGRDDLELAALQLLICLTQVIFPLGDKTELRRREREVLPAAEFDEGILPFLPWFDMRHTQHPFMQVRGVRANDITPIQKLFPGLPEGNNHAMFNLANEVTAVCENCAAIALFNQASNSPSFGGGFKGSLRGAAPMTTLVKGPALRRTIWRNVLDQEYVKAKYVTAVSPDLPAWVDPIHQDQTISAGDIGLFRGLFWQPGHVELTAWQEGVCQSCGSGTQSVTTGFVKEKFKFDVIGMWSHPHSPKVWREKKGKLAEWYASFTTVAPAWTQLAYVLTANMADKEGYQQAAVIARYREVFGPVYPGEPLNLIVGGYRASQANIVQRRHELFSLAHGWEGNLEKIKDLVEFASGVRSVLRDQVNRFGARVGVKGLAQRADEMYYQSSESDVHKILRRMDWKEAAAAKQKIAAQLFGLARQTFLDVTQPYQHEPKMLQALALGRRSLEKALKKLT